jgi:hypothetical protein
LSTIPTKNDPKAKIEKLKTLANLNFTFNERIQKQRYYDMANNLEVSCRFHLSEAENNPQLHDYCKIVFIKCVHYLQIFKEIIRICGSPGDPGYDKCFGTAREFMQLAEESKKTISAREEAAMATAEVKRKTDTKRGPGITAADNSIAIFSYFFHKIV